MAVAAITVDTLTEYVGTPSTTAYVQSCWDTVVAAVAKYIEGQEADVPQEALNRAWLEGGAELFHRRTTKNAVAQFAADGAPPVRVARDFMVAVRPILDPYLGPAIA